MLDTHMHSRVRDRAMKAIVFTSYGSPDVLRLVDVPKPTPLSGEVLVRVHATTVNRTDCGFRSAEYFINRLFSGLVHPKHPILGSEFAGVIEAIGSGVTKFSVGQRVFGLRTFRFGAHAEYLCVRESGSIAEMPAALSFREAAAVCDGLMLANAQIRCIDFSKSKRILINGATGSIGSAALQLAKIHGATVTATCKSASFELIRALGADQVVDYTQQDFTLLDEQFDIVLDAVGKSTFFKCRQLLRPGGTYFSTELGPYGQNIGLALTMPWLPGKKVRFPIPTDCQADILYFKQLLEVGKYRAVIDRTYPLEHVPEATRYVETGEKVGNVVIEVVPG